MENIIVVEAISTGLNYIRDITYRNYRPVVLETRVPEDAKDYARVREESYKTIKLEFEKISEKDSYEETLELVKSYHPVAVLPGSEGGVILANRLGEDLGLKTNPSSIHDAMTKKNDMHNALKKAGIRYILGQVVSSPVEALEFCKKNKLNTAVVKPLESAGSQGVTLCDNLEEMVEAVNHLMNENDIYGRRIQSCLIQERIVGTEYIVNTASCDGKHRLLSVFEYGKIRTPNGRYVYKSTKNIEKLDAGHRELIDYAFETVEAIGVRYGAVHGEYMIDEKGPVLIEVNCRPMGNSFPADYLDRCMGQHETDSILDCYIDSSSFEKKAADPYRPLCGMRCKFIIVPGDMDAESVPVWEIAKHLRSTYKISSITDGTPVPISKTIDLESAGGCVYMINEDPHVLEQDLAILEEIEEDYFGLLINDGITRRMIADSNEDMTTAEEIIENNECYGATLLLGDIHFEIKNVLSITSDEVNQYDSCFENVVIYLGESIIQMSETEYLHYILEAMKKVKRGGRVLFSKKTCSYISYKEKGAELLMKVLGLTIEAPKYGQNADVIIGTK